MTFTIGSGATIQCSFGAAPAALNVVPTGVLAAGVPSATVMDFQPLLNIPTFGTCSSIANPAVASATAAAAGVLTPMACTPVVVAPWLPGSTTVLVAGQPALTDTSTCQCSYGGAITVVSAGQITVSAP